MKWESEDTDADDDGIDEEDKDKKKRWRMVLNTKRMASTGQQTTMAF